MPETFGNVMFDSNGICNFCKEYKTQKPPLGKDNLLKIILPNIKRETSNYDCVVPISGGKDSIYLLYYVIKELKLRPIAVNVDNGFMHPIAKENIKNAIKILDVPLIMKSPGAIHKKLVKQVLAISESCGSFIRKFCVNCGEMHQAVAYQVALEHRVPVILWGSDPVESARAYDLHVIGGRRSRGKVFHRFIQRAHEMNLTLFKLIQIMPHLVGFKFLKTRESLIMGIPVKFISKGIRFTEGKPKIIHFFQYVHWDNIMRVDLLRRELNWQHPPNRESRFDCLLHSFGDHRFLQSHGISWNGLVSCNFIRANNLSRREVMLREEGIIKTVEEDCHRLIKSLGIEKYKMPVIDFLVLS